MTCGVTALICKGLKNFAHSDVAYTLACELVGNLSPKTTHRLRQEFGPICEALSQEQDFRNRGLVHGLGGKTARAKTGRFLGRALAKKTRGTSHNV